MQPAKIGLSDHRLRGFLKTESFVSWLPFTDSSLNLILQKSPNEDSQRESASRTGNRQGHVMLFGAVEIHPQGVKHCWNDRFETGCISASCAAVGGRAPNDSGLEIEFVEFETQNIQLLCIFNYVSSIQTL
jgi:hypothetical protein